MASVIATSTEATKADKAVSDSLIRGLPESTNLPSNKRRETGLIIGNSSQDSPGKSATPLTTIPLHGPYWPG